MKAETRRNRLKGDLMKEIHNAQENSQVGLQKKLEIETFEGKHLHN